MTTITDRLADAAAQVKRRGLKPWQPMPHQIPPPEWGRIDNGTFRQWWVLSGGRDAGKTAAGARAVVDHVLNDPPCFPDSPEPHRMLIIAPTLNDARTTCVRGPYGIRDHYRPVDLIGGEYFSTVRFPDGSEAALASMATRRDVDERLRSIVSNRCFAWLEEGAAAAQFSYAIGMLDHGLRSGAARGVVTSTPRRRRSWIRFVSRQSIVVTTGSTFDNTHRAATEIGAARHTELRHLYEDSPNGALELFGQLGDEVPGALWRLDWIDDNRLYLPADASVRDLGRLVVAVDPSKGVRDSSGIVAAVELADCWCGNGAELPHFGIVADATRRLPLTPAMRHAGAFATNLSVDSLIAESNGIGGRAIEILRALYPGLRVEPVHAYEGKQLRAETVALLYESNRVHHLGDTETFTELEMEMTTWVPPESVLDEDDEDPDNDDWSPDRLDAAVYALRDLAGIGTGDTGGWILRGLRQ